MNDGLDLVRGSGNVFRDLGRPNADLEQARAILAAKIIGVLDRRGLSVRAATTCPPLVTEKAAPRNRRTNEQSELRRATRRRKIIA